jgi:ankyrin repeat protein
MKKSILYIAVVLFSAGTAFASSIQQSPASTTIEAVSSETPLIEAINKGEMEAIKKLIESGADVNEVSANGMTPLLTAVKNNQLEVIEVLIAKGANINATNKRGMTALQIAERMQARSAAIAKLLADASNKG